MDFPDYRESRDVRLDWDTVQRQTITLLTPSGFRVDSMLPGRVDLIGPGMNSSRQSAIVGCSKIRVSSDNRSLTLEAELGAARRLGTFARLFPLLLTGGLLAILSIVFWFVLPNGIDVVKILLIVLAINVATWLVLGPVIARSIENRTRRALDALLTNLVALASP